MSPAQQKLMQYLPVVFAVFQVFFLTGLIIYYMAQAVLRIAQQAYITRRFYGHEESLGRQAQRAGDEARELAKTGRRRVAGCSGQVEAGRQTGRRPGQGASRAKKDARRAARTSATKRTTAPKGRPTPTGKARRGAPEAGSAIGSTGRQPEPRAAGNAGADQRREEPLTGRHAWPGRRTEWMMEWVETTARTIEEAQELALDQLGVVADEAEFEVLATPKPGLFGRLRGEARVRARVRPAPVRPKQDRRRGRRNGGAETDGRQRRRPRRPPPMPAERSTARSPGRQAPRRPMPTAVAASTSADAAIRRSVRQPRRKHHDHR